MQFTGLDMAKSSMHSESNRAFKGDAKEVRKKLRNRQSAQRARDRQKARMRWLERQVELLTVKNHQLQSENNTLRSYIGDGESVSHLRVPDIKKNKDPDFVDAKFHQHHIQVSPKRNHGLASDRIHGKLQVVNSEYQDDNGHVAAESLLLPFAQRKADSAFEMSSRHPARSEPNIRSKSPRSADAFRAFQTELSAKVSTNESQRKSLPLPGNQVFELSTEILKNNYKNLLPYYACASAYPPNLTLLSLLHRPLAMAVGINHHLYSKDIFDQGARETSYQNDIGSPAPNAKPQRGFSRGTSTSPSIASPMLPDPLYRESKASDDERNPVSEQESHKERLEMNGL